MSRYLTSELLARFAELGVQMGMTLAATPYDEARTMWARLGREARTEAQEAFYLAATEAREQACKS